MEKVEKIWFDGKLVDWDKATVHLLTHTLHYGGGVFEGIRAYKTNNGPAVFRLKKHVDRLFYSASVLEMDVPFSKEEITQAILEIVKVNKINECYIKPIIFFGYEKMGLNPTGVPVSVAVAAWPWGAYLSKDVVSVKISKYIRPHPKSTVVGAKICGSYANSILASLEVEKAGFDEALLLDHEGYVAEGPGENIFIVKDSKLFTPSSSSILNGVTRDSVIQIAKDLGIEAEEKHITVEELKSADEAFFTGTAAEICAIGKIDDTIINNEKMGVMTKKIKESYIKAIHGESEKYSKWLSPVN